MCCRRIEARVRLERLAANLKACHVGMPNRVRLVVVSCCGALGLLRATGEPTQPGACPQAAAPMAGGHAEHLDWEQRTALAGSPRALPQSMSPRRPSEAIDLASLAAKLLLQRNAAAPTLYWKLVLAPLPSGDARVSEQRLHNWLALQLQHGRPVTSPAGSVFVEGPVALWTCGRSRSAVAAELAVCLASPDGSGARCADALSGASGIVAVASISTDVHGLLRQLQPSNAAVLLPVLLVAASDEVAQHWQQQFAGMRALSDAPIHVVSVQGPDADVDGDVRSSAKQLPGRSTAFSRLPLVKGLQWLAAHSPTQPTLNVRLALACAFASSGKACNRPGSADSAMPLLQVVQLEVAARGALAATCAPLLHLPADAVCGPPGAELVCAALKQAAALVQQVAM